MQFFASAFSARLASCQADHIDSEIQSQLDQLLYLLGARRVCWYRLREGDQNLVRVYTASSLGVQDSPAIVTPQDLPHCAARLLNGERVALRRVDDLPAEAVQDREFLRQYSVGALLLIPSSGDSADMGVLAAAYSSWRKWSASLLDQLEVLGNVIVAAVERKAAQQAKYESDRLFRGVFEQATVGIALEDSDGRILYANPSLSSILGWSQEELRQMGCEHFKDAESEREHALFRELSAGLIDGYELEKQYTKKDGAAIRGRLRASLLKGSQTGQPLVIAMVEDITQRKMAEEELRRTKEELQELAAHLIQAQDEERHRISRELHDDIGQRFSLLATMLDELKAKLVSAGKSDEGRKATELMSQADDLATDLHRLSHQLHSSKLEHLGLCAALRELLGQLSRHNISGTLKWHAATDSLPREIALCLFRVAQEGLTNIVRHSRARKAVVQVKSFDSVVQLRIKDTGVGFDGGRQGYGLGLVSMRERLRIVGGTLAIHSNRGYGTEIVAEVRIDRNVLATSSKAA